MTYAILDKKGRNTKKPCVFPFIYKNKIHTKCVNSKKGLWCATNVNKKKEVTDYGFCQGSVTKTKKNWTKANY